MKKSKLSLFVSVPLIALLVVACGYYNPYVVQDLYKGPPKVILLDIWPNHTSEFGLESTLYRSMVAWFQKAEKIRVTRDPEKADYLIAGAITGIDLPGLTYTSADTVRDIKVLLTVRFSLKDKKSGAVLWDDPSFMLQEPLRIVSDAAVNRDNQKKAMEKLAEQLSEKIYIGTVNILTDIHVAESKSLKK